LEAGRTVTRKELSAAAEEAEKALQLRPSVRQVLSKLVACWGEQEWERLLVWPSNDYLMSHTGLSERTIRRNLLQLIELQLVTPKDSPNGKRFARRVDGAIVDAYGFDLTPIYARRGEWTALLDEQKLLRDIHKQAFDDVTVARRATEEALRALAQHFPTLDRCDLEQSYRDLLTRTPARSRTALPAGLLQEWQDLGGLAEDTFYQAGNGGADGRHIETNCESPSQTCNNRFRKDEGVRKDEQLPEHLSPTLIVEAYPAISGYGRPIRDLGDIVAAGRYLRASLGAHESAWHEAVADLGQVGAAVAVIHVLQLYDDDVSSGANRIKNAGGYFRALVRMVKAGKINLEVELLAMRRRRMA
jgi:replication initiation protein RepC